MTRAKRSWDRNEEKDAANKGPDRRVSNIESLKINYKVNQKMERIKVCVFDTASFVNKTPKFIQFFCQSIERSS